MLPTAQTSNCIPVAFLSVLFSSRQWTRPRASIMCISECLHLPKPSWRRWFTGRELIAQRSARSGLQPVHNSSLRIGQESITRAHVQFPLMLSGTPLRIASLSLALFFRNIGYSGAELSTVAIELILYARLYMSRELWSSKSTVFLRWIMECRLGRIFFFVSLPFHTLWSCTSVWY